MKEHALPQDVTGYRFHIIGNMTLKQFAEVAAGCVVGFLIYTTNLSLYIKWPLIFMSAGIGALAAFVPFEERPLDQWIIAFFRALYRPTQFYWQKTVKIPEPFLYTAKTEVHTVMKDVDLTPVRRQRVKEYLRSIDMPTENTDPIEEFNQQRFTEVTEAFQNPDSLTVAASVPEWAKTLMDDSLDTSNVTQHTQLVESAPSHVEVPQTTSLPQIGEEAVPTADLSQAPPVIFDDMPHESAQVTQLPLQRVSQATDTVSSAAAAGSVSVPKAGSISVDHAREAEAEHQTLEATPAALDNQAYIDQSQITTQPAPVAQQAVYQNAQLPFPDKPTEPNKVVGMVLDQQNNPLPNAIIEIVTEEGLPARAVKTNILGQFFITTPLNNGRYTLIAEKDGFQFSPSELVLSGEILEPIEVRSS